ncbi:MAG: hypothetical protein ACO1Q7_14880 [Gemmatimonas sp.]
MCLFLIVDSQWTILKSLSENDMRYFQAQQRGCGKCAGHLQASRILDVQVSRTIAGVCIKYRRAAPQRGARKIT